MSADYSIVVSRAFWVRFCSCFSLCIFLFRGHQDSVLHNNTFHHRSLKAVQNITAHQEIGSEEGTTGKNAAGLVTTSTARLDNISKLPHPLISTSLRVTMLPKTNIHRFPIFVEFQCSLGGRKLIIDGVSRPTQRGLLYSAKKISVLPFSRRIRPYPNSWFSRTSLTHYAAVWFLYSMWQDATAFTVS